MAHVAPAEYALHGREGPYAGDGPLDYFGGQVDPNPAYHRPPAVGPSFPPNHVPEDAAALADRMAGMELTQSARARQTPAPTKDLVVHVIEAAESALRDQASALRDKISENEQLRSKLRVREWELQNYKIDQGVGPRHAESRFRDDFQTGQGPQHFGAPPLDRRGLIQGTDHLTVSRDVWAGNGLPGDPQSSLIVHPNPQPVVENHYRYPPNGLSGQHYGPSHGITSTMRAIHHTDGGFSQTSSPSANSMSPIRLGREADPETRMQVGNQGITQHLAEANTSNGIWKQELVQRITRAQDEIKQLRKLLSDAAIKETQLVHEKYILEKRLSDLYLNIDHYQQELVDAAARAMSIRQEILDENARLTSELRAADQDNAFYADALLPLLEEFNLQPATTDPHSIVSGIKTLVQHLRDEGRPKESQHPMQSWRTDPTYQLSPQFPPPSPIHPVSRVAQSPETRGLEIVPQQPYLQPERPLSPTSPLNHTLREWEMAGPVNQHHAFNSENYPDASDPVRRSPYPGQMAEPPFGTSSRGIPSHDYSNAGHRQMNDAYSSAEEDSNTTGHSYGPEYSEKVERSPQLPTLPEEPASSVSEEEDPLPAIEGLGINGEAVLGSKINACGFSINGTSLCHFQWVRHYRDGSFTHIPGAGQPEYTITADDVDTMLSLECTPMDDRNRRGDMVRVFANNQNWITLEPGMEEQITEYLAAGQAVFDLKLVGENSQENAVEPAVLTLKRSSYELKRINGRKVVANERYTSESALEIKILQGNHPHCAILNNNAIIYFLELDDSRTRDLVVLTMREFMRAAFDRKRAKKRLWLTKK